MTVWFELLTRELAMLALLCAMGSGPVALLHRSYDRATRLALTPAYGLALGMCVLTTGLWRIPGYKLVWIGLVPLALLSVAVALVVRRRRQAQPEPLRRADALQLAAVVGVVLVALSWPLASRDTPGPIGGYAVADAAGYLGEIDGAQQQSIRTARDSPPPFADLTLEKWHGVSGNIQQIGFDPIEATANELLGLDATDTLAAFLIAVLAVTALGVFATVRMATGTRSPAAVLAAWLCAGPLFIQILMDGSQGAIVGQALILPFALAAATALRHRRLVDLLLAGLLAAGLQTGYPLFVPPVVLAAAAVLLVLLVRHRRVPGRVVLGLGGLIAVAIALTPVAFSRNVDYWGQILRGEFSFDGLPAYDLPWSVIPGWILQTREFYFLPHLSWSDADQLLVGAVAPLALVTLIAFGIARFRFAGWLVAIVGACALLALYTAQSESCSYCAQRNLLPTGPVLAALVGVSLAAVASSGRRGAVAALVLAGVTLALVGDKHLVESRREANAAYLLDPGVRDVLEHLPQDGPVHLEGFGQTDKRKMELPVVYHATNEATKAPLSILGVVDDGDAQQYIGGRRDTGPELRTDYRYVLTRHAAVDSGRRVIARSGPIALEERTENLDVTVEGGTNVAFSHVDPKGEAYLAPGLPLTLFVVGGTDAPAWVRIELEELSPTNVRPGLDLDARRRGRKIEICVQARGGPPGRIAEVEFDGRAVPTGRRPRGEFTPPSPASFARVLSVRATQRDCSPLPPLSSSARR